MPWLPATRGQSRATWDYLEDVEKRDYLSRAADLHQPVFLAQAPLNRIVGLSDVAMELVHAGNRTQVFVNGLHVPFRQVSVNRPRHDLQKIVVGSGNMRGDCSQVDPCSPHGIELLVCQARSKPVRIGREVARDKGTKGPTTGQEAVGIDLLRLTEKRAAPW
jgi:hypothetical protein